MSRKKSYRMKKEIEETQSKLVDFNANPTVSIGNTVTVEISDDYGTDTVSFRIVRDSPKSRAEISSSTPIAAALLGKSLSSVTKYSVQGNNVQAKILKQKVLVFL